MTIVWRRAALTSARRFMEVPLIRKAASPLPVRALCGLGDTQYHMPSMNTSALAAV